MAYKKIVLIQPPHTDRKSSLFPLGIGYIGMAILNEKVELKVFDIHALELNKQEVIDKLKKMDCDLIGINAFSTQYKYFKWLVGQIKSILPNVLIVVGGPLATFNARLILEKTYTDICVIGEGDVTISEIIKSNRGDFSQVSGIAFKSNEEISFTPDRNLIPKIDEIPFINYDIFPVDIYFKNIGLFSHPNKKSVNIITSRGCPYNCYFCSRTIPKTRRRSLKNVYDELKGLKDKYGIDGVLFNDELVVASKKRTLGLCHIMKELNLKWGCQARADTISFELLKEMKKNGCVYVGLGIESGSQRILDNMNKRTTVEQNENAIKIVLKAGLLPVVQMIYGYSGEDESTINETIEMLNRVHYVPPTIRSKSHLSLITPLPGSKLYDDCLINGDIRDEETYLMNLDKGYYIGAPALVNLTNFTDKEVLENKQKMEHAIDLNYRKYLKQNILRYLLYRFCLVKDSFLLELYKFGTSVACKNLAKKIVFKFRFIKAT